MKTRTLAFVSTLALIGAIAAHAEEKANRLVGVWELVSAKYTSPEATMDITPAEWRQIKVITKSHFVFIGQKPNRAKTASGQGDSGPPDEGRTFSAGGGTYTLAGDTYTEHIEFFDDPRVIAASLPFKCQFKGDQWIQSGKLPLKALGLEEYDVEMYEVWRRLE